MVVWVSEADRYGHAGYIPLDPERAANICGWRGSGIAMDLEAHVELGGAADGAVLMCFLKSIAISSGFTRCPKLIFATRK